MSTSVSADRDARERSVATDFASNSVIMLRKIVSSAGSGASLVRVRWKKAGSSGKVSSYEGDAMAAMEFRSREREQGHLNET